MNTKLPIYLLLITLVAFAAGSALAQSGNQGSRVQRELERTDDLIAEAEETVRASGNPLALQSLQVAVQHQKTARSAFGQGMHVMAYNQTKKAREAAQKAMTLARASEQLEGVVLRHLEKAELLLNRLGEHLAEHQDGPAQALFEHARNNLDRAWEFYRSGQYRPALKLADQADKTGQRLAAQLRLQERGSALFERRREQVTRQMEQARETAVDCDSEIASELLIRAREALKMADELHGRDNQRGALQALKRCQDLAGRALRDCQGTDALEQRYRRTVDEADRQAERLADIEPARAETARHLLDQVYEQLDLARRLWEEGKQDSAAAALQAAQLVLHQAQRYISGDL